MPIPDDIVRLVQSRPMLCEREIAAALYDAPYRQLVNPACRMLVKAGTLVRHGKGGANDPFRYTRSEQIIHIPLLASCGTSPKR
jgi:hypothetical protein